MRLGIVVVAALGCLGLSGCSGDSESGDGGGGDEDGVDWSSANPPPNIDITSCRSVIYAEADELESLDQCAMCCTTAGFPTASFLNDDHCTCGRTRDTAGDTICQAAADPASGAACEACCEDAGYSGHGYIGGTSGATCRCSGTTDAAVCAESVAGSGGSEACFFCCLNNGFITAGYSNFGEEECDCIDP